MRMHRARFELAIQRQPMLGQGIVSPCLRGFQIHIAIGLNSSGSGLERRAKQCTIERWVNENQIHALRRELIQMRQAIRTLHLHCFGFEALHLLAQLRHQGTVKLAQGHVRCAARSRFQAQRASACKGVYAAPAC